MEAQSNSISPLKFQKLFGISKYEFWSIWSVMTRTDALRPLCFIVISASNFVFSRCLRLKMSKESCCFKPLLFVRHQFTVYHSLCCYKSKNKKNNDSYRENRNWKAAFAIFSLTFGIWSRHEIKVVSGISKLVIELARREYKSLSTGQFMRERSAQTTKATSSSLL